MDCRALESFLERASLASRLVGHLDERVAAPLRDGVAEIVQLVALGGAS